MTPTIRIDDQVWKELQARAQAFVDSPNTVLRRLLGLEGDPVPERRSPAAARRNGGGRSSGRQQFLPQSAYRQPILRALARSGGEASVEDVLREVRKALEGRFSKADFEEMPSTPEERWRNLARWERKNMVIEGLLDRASPRGVWRLTEAGWHAAGREPQ